MYTSDKNLEYELNDNIIIPEVIKNMTDEELHEYIKQLEASAAVQKQTGHNNITYDNLNFCSPPVFDAAESKSHFVK